jgi:cyanophycin synthetase
MSQPVPEELFSIGRILALRGPNIWAHFPVLEIWIDLPAEGPASQRVPAAIGNKLLAWLPSLARHELLHAAFPPDTEVVPAAPAPTAVRASIAPAKLLQYLVLELQTLAGTIVSFGQTDKLETAATERLVVEYQEEQVGRAALELARRMLAAAAQGTTLDVTAELARLRELAYDRCLGPSTRSIVDAATRRGVPHLRLNSGSLVQLGYGSKQRRILTAETDRTSAIAESIAQDKELTRQLLSTAGIPVPEGRPVASATEAWEVAQEIGLPVVVKPQFGNHGRGVTTNLLTEAEVTSAYENARLQEETVVVEKFIEGDDYRLLVVGDRLIAAARREPAQVLGDGKSTIRELVEVVNRDPRRSDGHSTVMSCIRLDEVSEAVLAQQGFSPDSVPKAGHLVYIRRNANLSTGGTACDVTEQVHPELAARAVEAARIVGLDIAGIDVIAKDISLPLEAQRGGIVEVNAGPGLRMHLQPSEGKPQPVGEAIVDMLFAPGDNGRIPVVAVTGVNGKTTTTRLIAHIIAQQGKRVGMTTTDGVYLGARRIDEGDCSGPQSARRLLTHPLIDAAVLETARGGMLREGLAFDACDVAVVTMIGDGDHLGLGHIHTLEQLAAVKRIPVEAVSSSGAAVLNADDPLVAAMAPACRGSVVFFSHTPDNPLLVKRRAAGGRVVFVREGALILANGESEFSLLALDRVPLTMGGKIKFQVENVLASAAATWALGVPAEVIRAGLESFAPSLECSPGRFNVLSIHGATVVVDYGHNPSALKSVLEAIASFQAARRTVVYSAAGDRRDSDMIEQGRILGDHFDRVLLYEGGYVRGRQQGDIIKLFETGLSHGTRVKEKTGFASWKAAAENALQGARPGDCLLIQADEVDETVAFFRDYVSRLPASNTIIDATRPS